MDAIVKEKKSIYCSGGVRCSDGGESFDFVCGFDGNKCYKTIELEYRFECPEYGEIMNGYDGEFTDFSSDNDEWY